jgi:hypothetical protein
MPQHVQAAVQSAGTSQAAAVSMLVESISAEVDRVRVHIRAMQQRRLQVNTIARQQCCALDWNHSTC